MQGTWRRVQLLQPSRLAQQSKLLSKPRPCAARPPPPLPLCQPQPARAQSTGAAGSDSSNNSLAPHASSATGWLENGVAGSVRGNYDAIMVLGGGLASDGGLPEWVRRRLEAALYIYRQQASGGCPIVLLGSGTPHKPPVIDQAGFVLHESTRYAQFLLEQGVPATHILKELQSYDTVGNGFFSLVIHAIPAAYRSIAVVTSDFHMPRTRATFDFIYGLAGRQYHGSPSHFALHYHPVSDAGIFDASVLEARAEKEAAAVATWHRNTQALASMQDLHAWLFATHLCYSVVRQHEFGRERNLDPRLLASY